MSLLTHTVPDDRPAITHSVDTLEAERYRVAWALTRPLPAPCAHWALEAGERVRWATSRTPTVGASTDARR